MSLDMGVDLSLGQLVVPPRRVMLKVMEEAGLSGKGPRWDHGAAACAETELLPQLC